MRKEAAVIDCSIWSDPDWTGLTGGAQLLAMLCMGIRKTGDTDTRRIVRRTGWDAAWVEEARKELRASPFSHVLVGITKRRRMPRYKSAAVFARDGHTCVHCGTSEQLTVDHVWPHSRGGSDDMENLQTLCHSCNSKKGARV
jgi:5-methylcytosine-specific restriction endonuclease McrA